MAVAEQELEQIGTNRKSTPTSDSIRRISRSSGPLQGFNDPATKDFKPLRPRLIESVDRVENSSSENEKPDSEPTTQQAFRAGTVEAQRRQQSDVSGQQLKRNNSAPQGQKVKDIPTLAPVSAQDMIEKIYKRSWQIAQEGIEDLVIPTFFLLDLVLIPMYLVRWVGGNMLGGLFTISREVPAIPGVLPGQKIDIKLVPGYSLADPLDYVRHIKFLLLGVLPLAILGFVVMLIYYWTKWADISDPGVRGLWGILIKTLPGFNG